MARYNCSYGVKVGLYNRLIPGHLCRMAIEESDVTCLTTTTMGPMVLKRNSDDIGYEYVILVDPLNKEKVWCLLCGHCNSWGIYRLKQHVGHVGSVVTKCKKTTPERLKTSVRNYLRRQQRRERRILLMIWIREKWCFWSWRGWWITCVESRVESLEPHKLDLIHNWI
jgi:hypothetical protein